MSGNDVYTVNRHPVNFGRQHFVNQLHVCMIAKVYRLWNSQASGGVDDIHE